MSLDVDRRTAVAEQIAAAERRLAALERTAIPTPRPVFDGRRDGAQDRRRELSDYVQRCCPARASIHASRRNLGST